jgi:glycerol-3-phosphate cytidylyltransferase
MDTDIGIMFKDFPPSALKKIESIGFQITNTFGYPKNSLEISLRRFGIKTDIFFYYRELDYMYHSAFSNKKTGQYNSRIDYRYKPFNLKEVEFLGKTFFVPSDEMYFLETKYGKSWKTPIQKWDWAHGPLNHYDTGTEFDLTEKDAQIEEWGLSDDKNFKKRIITYGTFDTFHYGHLELLKKAKQFGNYLTVGLSTDEFNKLKGKESKFSYAQRYEWLKSISYVDEIIPETNWEQKENDVKDRNIDVMVMGDDWVGKFDYLPCRVIYLQRTPEISSTKIKSITQ